MIQETLEPGLSQTYRLAALQGQPMIAMIDSFIHDVTLGITGNDCSGLINPSQLFTARQGIQPVSLDNFIYVIPDAASENINFSITIARRIQCRSGVTSATVSGATFGGSNGTYVLYLSTSGWWINIARI